MKKLKALAGWVCVIFLCAICAGGFALAEKDKPQTQAEDAKSVSAAGEAADETDPAVKSELPGDFKAIVQEKEYWFNDDEVLYIGRGELKVCYPEEAEEILSWKLVARGADGAEHVLKESGNEAEWIVSAAENLPEIEERCILEAVVDGIEEVCALTVVRDLAAPELLLPGDPAKALEEVSVVPEVRRLFVRCDVHESIDDVAVAVNGGPAEVFLTEEGQKSYLVFDVDPEEGELDVITSDGLGNERKYHLTLDREPFILIDGGDDEGRIFYTGETISGQTETGALVEILSEDGVLASMPAEEGLFEFVLKPEMEGSVQLRVSDEMHSVERKIRVEQRVLAPIQPDGDAEILLGAQANQISGSGEPGESVYCRINGGEAAWFADVDEHGRWSGEFALEDGAAEATIALFYVNHEDISVQLQMKSDGECLLQPDPCTEGMNVLSGKTDPHAAVVLNGEQSTTADSQGNFAIELTESLRADEVLKLRAEDGNGNTAEAVIMVAQAETAKIELHVEDRADDAEDVKVVGTAEPEQKVRLLLNGRKVGVVTAAEDGSFELIVPVAQLSEGENTFRACYEESALADGDSETISMVMDAGAPVLKLDCEEITDQTSQLSGSVSEPCEIVILVDGEQLAKYDGGSFSVSIPAGLLHADAAVVVQATDRQGNVSEISMTVVGQPDSAAMFEQPAAGMRHEFDCSLRIAGCGFSGAEPGTLSVMINGAQVCELVPQAAEPAESERAGFADFPNQEYFWRFDAAVDVSGLPLGRNVLALADAEGRMIAETEVELVKPADYLPVRIVILAVLLVGFAASLTGFVLVGKRIKADCAERENRNISRSQKTLERGSTTEL